MPWVQAVLRGGFNGMADWHTWCLQLFNIKVTCTFVIYLHVLDSLTDIAVLISKSSAVCDSIVLLVEEHKAVIFTQLIVWPTNHALVLQG